MKQRSLKFVQITLVLALLLGNVGSIMAAPPSLALAAPIGSSAAPDTLRPNRLVQLREAEGRAEALPSAEVSVAGQNAQGWTTLITDTFDAFPANWSTYTETVEQTWGPTMVDADTEYNPDSLTSVWPAAAGLDAVDPISGTYPNNLESWMIRGPIDLSGWLAAELDFSLNYDIEEGDWLGVCVATFGAAPLPTDFDQDADCSWITGSSDGWEHDYFDLTPYVAATDLYIAFVFQSDASNDEPHFGAFVDELVLWVNDEEIELHDPNGHFVDYTRVLTESFDTTDLDSDAMWKQESTPISTGWVTTTAANDDSINPLSTTSISPTPGDSYSAGQRSWLFYGPVDLTDYVEADVLYGIKRELNHTDDAHHSENDWLAFCSFASEEALAEITSDDVHLDHCSWWSDHSGETWQEGHHDLTAFAGSSQVYLALYFEANTDNAAGGVYIDELVVEGHHADTEVPPAVTFHPDGLELVNGDFSNGLTGWAKETPAGKSGDVTVVDGRAALTGNQRLLHNIEILEAAVDVNIHFNYAMSTTENIAGNDLFCLSLVPTSDHAMTLADLGCWDASHLPDHARDGVTDEPYGHNIPHELTEALRGQFVTLVAELVQNDTRPTTLFLDDMVVYTLGKTGRDPISADAQAASPNAIQEVAAHRDPNEPNDNTLVATPLACNQTKAGLFGDVAPTTPKDQELFKIDRVPVGKLVIDVDAATLQPASSADTLLRIYDSAFTLVATFDDDGKTVDSFGDFMNTVADATYYINLYNFNADGPTAYYTLNAKCGQTDAPPAAPQLAPPTPTPGAGNTWTMILYMNGEDQNCVTRGTRDTCWDKATYEKVIQQMEGIVAAKPGLLNVVVLLDGPNFPGTANDVTRYVVQPNGTYTLGVNKWELPEANMGDPKTLVDFANWAISHYPADHYYLAVDDHGHGAFGASNDHHGVGATAIDDGITPAEMHSALAQITLNGQRKIDIFGYEACLMGMVENAYDLKDYVNYFTAFQSVSWTALQYPAYFKDLTATDTVEQVAKRIIQTFPTTSQAYTFGLIRSDQMGAVKTQLDAFANALMGVDAATLMAIRNATQGFGGSPAGGSVSWFGYIDLWDFAQRVKAAGHAVNEATALQAAIDAAVIEKKAVAKVGEDDYTNYHGLSIIYPQAAYGNFSMYCQDFRLSDSGQGGWAKLMQTKVGICGGGSAQTSGILAVEDRQVNVPLLMIPKEDAQVSNSIYLPITAK